MWFQDWLREGKERAAGALHRACLASPRNRLVSIELLECNPHRTFICKIGTSRQHQHLIKTAASASLLSLPTFVDLPQPRGLDLPVIAFIFQIEFFNPCL